MNASLRTLHCRLPCFGLFLFAAISLSAVEPAHTVKVTSSGTPPADNIVIEYLPTAGPGDLAWRFTRADGKRDVGQTFTPRYAFTLDKITLKLSDAPIYSTQQETLPYASFSLSLATFKDVKATSPGMVLWTLNGNLPRELPHTGDWLTFTPSIKTALTPGQTYGFILSFASEDEDRRLNFIMKFGDGYKEGKLIMSSDGASWLPKAENDGNDFHFVLQELTSSLPDLP